MPKKQTKGPRLCYGLMPSEMADPSIKEVTPIIIKEGERGYHETDWKWNKEHAVEARDTMNARLGISPEEAERMMMASMFPKGKAALADHLLADLVARAHITKYKADQAKAKKGKRK